MIFPKTESKVAESLSQESLNPRKFFLSNLQLKDFYKSNHPHQSDSHKMAGCSFTTTRDWCFRFSFSTAGLKSTTIDLGDGTTMHFWVPKSHKQNKPTLILIHGVGANAMWQWNEFISPFSSKFNVYVPDLLFFGESYTTRPERTEGFQAECLMRALEIIGVKKMSLVGISYGGFVGYSLAEKFPEAVEKVVIICAGVCLEEKDMDEGMFTVKSVDEAFSVLFPQTPEKMKELIKTAFYKPKLNVPNCFLVDYIDVMCSENLHERKELLEAIHKGRRLSNLAKITQPTLILWGEHDQVFPLELGHRLKRLGMDVINNGPRRILRHLGDIAELIILKDAGHALNAEKPKELRKYIDSFLAGKLNPLPPPKIEANSNGCKVD